MSLISVILPVFNEEELIASTHVRMCTALAPLEQNGDAFELIYVNDGSSDNSPQILADIAANDHRAKVLTFSRNFGQQIAVTAGIDYADGDAVAVIDADMQDPPEVILEMVAKWREGYEVIYGKRRERDGESFFKKFTSASYYRTLNAITTIDFPVDTGDFRLMDRKVVLAMRAIPEHNRYVRGLISWVGFKQTAVEFHREARMAGETKYPLKKMVKLAMDGILSFSFTPLRFILSLGVWFIIIAILGTIAALVWVDQLGDMAFYSSLTLISLFFSGIILCAMGILGEYIARIMDESRARPLYIVKEKLGF
ncbi:glycosyl transferase [Clostridia bacterium]|nr:glycosyl transferase [Clostridia bacterium]